AFALARFAMGDDALDGRQQVGERLAHARARLDQQLAAVGERTADGVDHRRLFGALLEAIAQAPGDRAVGLEDGGGIKTHASGLRRNVREVFAAGGMAKTPGSEFRAEVAKSAENA